MPFYNYDITVNKSCLREKFMLYLPQDTNKKYPVVLTTSDSELHITYLGKTTVLKPPANKCPTPDCPSERFVLYRTLRKKQCAVCDHTFTWELDPGQHPIGYNAPVGD